ncbi:sulfatase [Verrucomicrobiota bacterium]|nr:sulfatase [Verrucomicrobiota bacterium]
MTSRPFPRRTFLQSAVAGSLLFPGVVRQLLADSGDPLAPLPAQFPAKAKRVIFLFMTGGVSHVDTFDPKPALTRDHGKEIKADHPEIKNRPGYERIFLKRPQWEFAPHGQCGTEVSTLFPHVATCVDQLALIRSLHTSHSNHYNATLGMHTGSFAFARPSLGSWVSYGLGTVNRNLPSFVVIAPKQTYAGTQVYANDFLPGAHQGTLVVPGPEPVANIAPRTPAGRQALELAALQSLNEAHLVPRDADPLLAARLRSFETAFGMQMAVPDAFDFQTENAATLASYGLQRGQTTGFGWQCLAARRLVERGVRFVELIDTGSSGNWDAHGDMMSHVPLAKNVDQPVAALLRDLQQRGMLDDTLVVWTTEFGRTPFNNTADAKGREHHPWAFSSWLAGAGVKRGIVHGATDEHGLRAVEQPVHVHDFHATILHLMGFDHERLTYRHAGRDYRLTDVFGHVVREVLA